VARSARKTLLEAAFVTRIGEDVLTEMLAHVLVTDDDVTAGVAEAGDPILQSAREHELATPLSWQQVLDLCTGVAEGRGGPEWRQRARSVDAPARQRTLAEFSWYLEHRRVAVDIEALSEAGRGCRSSSGGPARGRERDPSTAARFSTAGTEYLEDEVEIEPVFFASFVFARPIAPKVDEALRDAPWRTPSRIRSRWSGRGARRV
jgi:hypothetical protein